MGERLDPLSVKDLDLWERAGHHMRNLLQNLLGLIFILVHLLFPWSLSTMFLVPFFDVVILVMLLMFILN